MTESPDQPKSKTRKKNEMLELQQLGESLLQVPPNIYKKLPIPEELNIAITEARKISSPGAKRRQLQFIGKLMRRIDPDPIRIAIEQWQSGRPIQKNSRK